MDKTRSTAPLCRFCEEENETFYHFATNCPCFRLSCFHYFQNDTCFINGQWSIRSLLDFSNIPSITAALGGTFDPFLHLEQQQDFEDLIEAEQDDANLQPGRQHDPNHHLHSLSDSDCDEDPSAITSQYISARAYVLNAQQIHTLSSSSESEEDTTLYPENPDDPYSFISTISNDATEILRNLEAEAGVEGVAVASPNNHIGIRRPLETDAEVESVVTENCNRERINYDTMELTDDDYLNNDTEDSLSNV